MELYHLSLNYRSIADITALRRFDPSFLLPWCQRDRLTSTLRVRLLSSVVSESMSFFSVPSWSMVRTLAVLLLTFSGGSTTETNNTILITHTWIYFEVTLTYVRDFYVSVCSGQPDLRKISLGSMYKVNSMLF